VAEALAGLNFPVYFPAHPRTAKALKAAGLWARLEAAPTVKLAEPTTYFTSLALIRYAAVVITDSGGVQREAYLYDVPTLTLRDRTEWPETVAAGVNRLVDVEPRAVSAGVKAASGAGRARRPRLELVCEPPPSAAVAEAVAGFI
jgi:UDP-N-acetylglucosamine 2-epimerase